MSPRGFSEHWAVLRPRLTRVQDWLAAQEWSRTLTLLLWPVVAVVLAALAIRKASTGKELADLISALASLTWPIVVLMIVSWFSPELRAILTRLRKGKLLGTEFELDDLQAKTASAEEKADLRIVSGGVPAPLGDKLEATGTVSPSIADDAIEEVLREAARSPKLGLMLLSTKVERAIRELIADTPYSRSRSAIRPRTMVEALASTGQLSEEIGQAVALFLSVRNRIVHGEEADYDEIMRAIDSGTRLLRLLLSQPRPQTPSGSE